MATFSTQFHATLDEIVDFVEKWATTYHLYVTALHHPFRAESLSIGHIREVLAASDAPSIVFTAQPADLSAATGNQFLDKNDGSLILRVGRLVERGLEQSCLSTMQSNPTWAKINADLKRHAPAGATTLHEKTGETGTERNFRFTAGAKALSESGTPLRQFAQMSTIFRPR